MYYSPPKSSLWGHSLRGMRPDVLRERCDGFLARTASGTSYATGSVFLQPGPSSPLNRDRFEVHFTTLLGVDDALRSFSGLDEARFELCFQELLDHPELYEPGRCGVVVSAMYSIDRWKIGDRVEPTQSAVSLLYGAMSVIVPRFEFATMETFDHLRQGLMDAKICTLNPKHIKGRKR